MRKSNSRRANKQPPIDGSKINWRFGQGLFVTGTGTGVGKTLASIGLALIMRRRGYAARYWKPIQSGEPADEDFAQTMLPQGMVERGAIRLKAPLSPNQAAAKEGRKDLSAQSLLPPQGKGFLIVEGIGGVMVPLNGKETVIDLILHLKFPVIITALTGLGTLNHSLLTLWALKSRHIPVIGWILNGPPHPDNKRDLEQWGKIPALGEIPKLSSITPQSLLKAFQNFRLPPSAEPKIGASAPQTGKARRASGERNAKPGMGKKP